MHKLPFLILFAVVFSLTVFFYFSEVDVDWDLFAYWLDKAENISELQNLGFMLVFILLYLTSIVFILPFCGVLSILGGTIFGWASFCLSMFSSLVGAFVVFRFLHSKFFNNLSLVKSKKIKKNFYLFENSKFLWLIFLRLLPILPFSLVSAFSVQFLKDYKLFLLGTFIGSTPGLIAHTLIGIQIKNIILSDDLGVISFNALFPVTFLCLIALLALYINTKSRETNL